MRRSIIVLVVSVLMVGVVLALGFYVSSTLGAWFAGLGGGLALGFIAQRRLRRTANHPTPIDPRIIEQLMSILVDIGDALQETAPRAIQQRGGWNQSLFDEVLAHVEQQTPRFQRALITYMTQPAALDAACITALLAVDRLSAAYTYWTRLFPPRQPDESMFVLSLLQDLSEKVEHAISLLEAQL